ncbi:unnamed protein product, partial [Oppiella nova]
MFWKRNIDSTKRAVLITGCDSGFGNRLALRLNDIGFYTYAAVLSADSPGAQDLSTKCKHADSMYVLEMDVTRDDQIDRCFEQIKVDLNVKGYELWAVVNNAGIVSYGNLEWGSMEEYIKLFDVNVFGVVRVTRKFIPLLRQSRGRIVLTASLGGRLSADLLSAYCMTKAAVISFSDALRREMHKFKIQVTTIEPGVFKTGMYYTVVDILQRNWSQTDESVRQIYGENYFNELIKRYSKGNSHGVGADAGADIDKVVNDMVDAVISRRPNRYYRPVNGLLPSLAARFVSIIPQFFIDRYFYATD